MPISDPIRPANPRGYQPPRLTSTDWSQGVACRDKAPGPLQAPPAEAWLAGAGAAGGWCSWGRARTTGWISPRSTWPTRPRAGPRDWSNQLHRTWAEAHGVEVLRLWVQGGSCIEQMQRQAAESSEAGERQGIIRRSR